MGLRLSNNCRKVASGTAVLLCSAGASGCAGNAPASSGRPPHPHLEFTADRVYSLPDSFVISGAEFGADSSVWIWDSQRGAVAQILSDSSIHFVTFQEGVSPVGVAQVSDTIVEILNGNQQRVLRLNSVTGSLTPRSSTASERHDLRSEKRRRIMARPGAGQYKPKTGAHRLYYRRDLLNEAK